MNATTIERLDELEELALDESPPCEFMLSRYPCRQPSVARVHSACPCGKSGYTFLCERHLTVLRSKRGAFCPCSRSFEDNDWRLA